MKHGTIKTLGVAALGAAFAAAGAGAASAADSGQTAVGGAAQGAVPVQGVTDQLPAVAAQTLDVGQKVLGSTNLPVVGDAGAVTGLLGGLPVGGDGLAGALPGGLPIG